jgi:hypothetical protein
MALKENPEFKASTCPEQLLKRVGKSEPCFV